MSAFRLMAVHAHPDDEASKGAATTAMYAATGHEVMVVTCTGGERGDVLNPNYHREITSLDEMREVRSKEMEVAAKALGVQHRWLGWVDTGLPEGDPLPPLPEGSFATLPVADAAAPLIAAIREFRPHVITTYDPTGGYPHPDHIMCHKISAYAFEAAANEALHPELGEPWQAAKLYYNHGFSLSRMRAIHGEMEQRGLDSPFGDWIESRASREIPERPVTTHIECSEYFGARDDALRAHATQIDPFGWFFAVPRDVELVAWSTEEYELGTSLVPVELPESDLFAGIDPSWGEAEWSSWEV